MAAVKLKPRGRAFQTGADPRRNIGGGRPHRATAALAKAVTEDDLVAMWQAGMVLAKGGDEKWATLIAAYLDGKPVARTEEGAPGDFDLDLSGWSDEEIEGAVRKLRRVK